MIPAGILLFAFDATFFGGVAFEQVEGDVAQDVEVFRGIAGPYGGLVFAEANLTSP